MDSDQNIGVRLHDSFGQNWVIQNECLWNDLLTNTQLSNNVNLGDANVTELRRLVALDTMQAHLQLLENRRCPSQWQFFGGFAGKSKLSADHMKNCLDSADEVAIFDHLIDHGVPTEKDFSNPNCEMHKIKSVMNWSDFSAELMNLLGPAYGLFEWHSSFDLLNEPNMLCGRCLEGEIPVIPCMQEESTSAIRQLPVMVRGYGHCMNEGDNSKLKFYWVVNTPPIENQAQPGIGRIADPLIFAFTPCLR